MSKIKDLVMPLQEEAEALGFSDLGEAFVHGYVCRDNHLVKEDEQDEELTLKELELNNDLRIQALAEKNDECLALIKEINEQLARLNGLM